MIKRFEITPPDKTSTAFGSEERSVAAEEVIARAEKLIERARTIIIERPGLMVPIAFFIGVTAGWIVKRR
jgi:hypothetical protein